MTTTIKIDRTFGDDIPIAAMRLALIDELKRAGYSPFEGSFMVDVQVHTGYADNLLLTQGITAEASMRGRRAEATE